MSVGEVERALTEACRRGHAEVIEFTVAPRDPCPEQVRGGHEWLIEFADPPRAPETFVRALDEALQRCNAEYRRMRGGDVSMAAPSVLELPAGTFYRWMRIRGAPGDRREVPRVANDRVVADSILATVAVYRGEPLIAVGSMPSGG